MGLELHPTEGWRNRFKHRNGLSFKREHGEKQSTDLRAAEHYLAEKLPALLSQYSPEDIYNADETELDADDSKSATDIARNITTLRAIYLMFAAWANVTATTITNCFRKAGFASVSTVTETGSEAQADAPPDDTDHFSTPVNMSDELFNEFIDLDNQEPVTGELDDKAIVESVKHRKMEASQQQSQDVEEDDDLRISNHHAFKQSGGTPAHLAWGKSINNAVDEAVKESIRTHIKSIPRIESHYCRADTNKEYISQYGLNVTSLYRKYVEKCVEDGSVPGKLHLYCEIFNTEFNIAFHFPKSDRCDKCEEKQYSNFPTKEQISLYDAHEKGKEETRAEKNRDRENENAFVVCFDLENVFALPRANVGTFFYKRKLNTFNMTAHCSISKKGYGAIWHEGLSGRGSNDIASAVIKILNAIADDHSEDPRLKHIILWSDSCVPQNQNRVFSTALKYFLTQHQEVESIQQKFSPAKNWDDLLKKVMCKTGMRYYKHNCLYGSCSQCDPKKNLKLIKYADMDTVEVR
ncbi:hypothetical protein RRG08_047051 [Elysia crispata]|uniref:HTH CENPB-type domain-containing protein n=1 Tax=Elysia crispata TaxID=231223 RepID=A0AAE0ZI80_9GAST|nr:hypothetical protein RRG08_047051 [Elysia crispata]